MHQLLSTHKLHTASGPDGISSQMLRATASSICHAITYIFNESPAEAKVPASWKTAYVTPIPKPGDPSAATNYSPISLLPLVSKVLERIIHSRISKFLYANGLLSNCQFGFRPRSSTQEALLHVTNTWHNQLTSNRQVAAVFFDVKKAFDSIPHHHLIKALANIGITGPLLRWISDYLTDRKQRVVLDGTTSDHAPVTSGVPQGSILGPLLFNIAMNSITSLPLSPGANLILYADDILLYKSANSETDIKQLQHDVDIVYQWMQSQGLTPNLSKTQLLPITRSRRAPSSTST